MATPSIKERVLARRDLDAHRATADIDTLAAKLNEEGLTTSQSRFVTARVIRTLPEGKAILAALKAARTTDDDIELAYTFLMQEAGLDIGDPTTQSLITGLVAQGVLSESQASSLKALGTAPLTVSRWDVAAALFKPDGTELE